MKRFQCLIPALLASFASTAWGYGGGGSSASCAEPKFFSESLGNDGSVAALSDITFVASDTEPDSLTVKVNGNAVPIDVARRANGDVSVSAHLIPPITAPGRVQIAVAARSPEGCSGFQAYYVVIR